MRKTIRNVTIVVVVLIISCQVFEKLKIGPVRAQMPISVMAVRKAQAVPTILAMRWATLRKISFIQYVF